MKHALYVIAVAAILISVGGCSQEKSEMKNETVQIRKDLEGPIRAPEFPHGMEWLNTDSALALSDFRGKFVILDFWTYCCINCMHVLPKLHKLEQKYAEELVVIGVHSAKFPNELSTETIRQAILRYDIEHPVVNDDEFRIWDEYGARAWPTLVLINPNGRIIDVHPGEGAYRVFDPILKEAIPYFEKKGDLVRSKTNFRLEKDFAERRILAFPGKISVSAEKRQLYISDSNNDRVIIADQSGGILDVIGSGSRGSKDGTFENAEFNNPQGTHYSGGLLYIADTDNHMVRVADLQARTVKTIFGTGEQALYSNYNARWTDIALNSPWDLLVHDKTLFIAMAGPHQIWAGDLEAGSMRLHAGSRREARVDGPLLEAALAQPSGITTDGKRLYFADSETSSIRWADIDMGGEVGTIVGEDLFEYGDADGPRSVARLQHPLGIEYVDGTLFVADTYNSKIKTVDIEKAISQSYSGVGRHGYKDGERLHAMYSEPGGIDALGDTLYIADTNNHLIRTINRKTGRVGTLKLTNLELLHRKMKSTFTGRTLRLDPVRIAEGKLSLEVAVRLPDGYKYAADAPQYIHWQAENSDLLFLDAHNQTIRTEGDVLRAHYDLKARMGETELQFDIVVYFCEQSSDVCLVDRIRVIQPVRIGDGGSRYIKVKVEAMAGKQS